MKFKDLWIEREKETGEKLYSLSEYFNDEHGTIEFDNIKDLIVGTSIEKIVGSKYGDEIILTLSNSIELRVCSNEGCGGCGNGWFLYDEIITCGVTGNVIINATVDCDYDGEDGTFTLNIYSLDKRMLSAEFKGGDNGYYGYGIEAHVKLNEEKLIELIEAGKIEW